MKYTLEEAKNLIKIPFKIKSIQPIGEGNHCQAFLVNNNLVVKLPKHKKASDCLDVEIKVLNGLKNKLDLQIPTVEYSGKFGENNFTFYVSKIVDGKSLTKLEFENLSKFEMNINAEIVAKFLFDLHNQKQILNIKRKDYFLLHGDFSLNHLRFDDNNIVCGVIDFGDARVGKFMSDFVYLLDDEDDEEFGEKFGNMVLEEYLKLRSENNKYSFYIV